MTQFVQGLSRTIGAKDPVGVYFGPASCPASVLAERQLEQMYERCAAVMAPEYDITGGYDELKVYANTRSKLLDAVPSGWSGKLLICGASGGAVSALRLAKSMQEGDFHFDVRVVFEDEVLSANGMMPDARTGAQKATKLPGLVQRALPKVLLKKLMPDHGPTVYDDTAKAEVAAYVNDTSLPRPHVLRVQDAMELLTVRGFLRFGAAILAAEVPENVIHGSRVAVIHSGVDTVRFAEGADADLSRAVDGEPVFKRNLSGGHHVAFDACSEEWNAALEDAFDSVLK